MKVYTYYDPTVQQCGLPPQDGVIRLWYDSWRKFGWKPRVLTDRMVRQHQEFKKFSEKINTLPTINARAYENACYLRWLALQDAGGGWMTDYDVMNFGFKPRPGRGQVEMLDLTYVPCAVWSSTLGIASICRMIMRHKTTESHVSDMHIFKSKFDSKKFGPPGTECVEFGVPGWQNAPLVHFAAGKCQQYASKVDAIREASKFHA